MELHKYLKDNRHLPRFLKDFHDQKDFFKAVWDWQNEGEKPDEAKKGLEGHTWVSQHIFTVDVLLRFLACYGYKLQKIRKPKMAFYDLGRTIRERKDREAEMLKKLITGGKDK